MYGISFTPQPMRSANVKKLTFGESKPAHSPTILTEEELLSHIDSEVAHIAEHGERLQPEHPLWNSPVVNLVSPKKGMNALAAAIVGGNARLIRDLLNCPYIDVNTLLPLDRTPKQVWVQLRQPQKQALLESLPRIQGQRRYTVLDLFNALITSPSDWDWIRDFHFPLDEIKKPNAQRNKQAIGELIQTLKDRGAKSAADLRPDIAPATT